jgi:hypothetical protein
VKKSNTAQSVKDGKVINGVIRELLLFIVSVTRERAVGGAAVAQRIARRKYNI